MNANFPVVCIGVSAGAMSALRMLFRRVSPRVGMAFVVIHHRRTPTHLPEILSSCTKMPVELATDGLELRPDHVYILPSGKEMLMSDGFLVVQPRSKLRGWPNVITVFIDSLAKSGHLGIAVILSGIDADGAAALRAFKKHGGTTIVQELRTADFQGMPRAAIRTGCVDYILPPEAIAAELEKIAEVTAPRILGNSDAC